MLQVKAGLQLRYDRYGNERLRYEDATRSLRVSYDNLRQNRNVGGDIIKSPPTVP
jgi:hypothetical protein